MKGPFLPQLPGRFVTVCELSKYNTCISCQVCGLQRGALRAATGLLETRETSNVCHLISNTSSGFTVQTTSKVQLKVLFAFKAKLPACFVKVSVQSVVMTSV